MRKSTAILLVLAAGAIALKGTKPSKKTLALEARYNANYTTVWTELNSHATALTDLAPIVASGNAEFLAFLSELPNQTTDNDNTFSDAAFTGLANAVNNLQHNLQANGFETG